MESINHSIGYEESEELPSYIETNTTSNRLPQLHLAAYILDKQLQGYSRDNTGKLIRVSSDLVGSDIRKKIVLIVEQFTQDVNVLNNKDNKKAERDKILAMNTIINFVHNSLESRIGINNVNAVFEATYAALNNAVAIQNEGRKLANTLFGHNSNDDIPGVKPDNDGSGY